MTKIAVAYAGAVLGTFALAGCGLEPRLERFDPDFLPPSPDEQAPDGPPDSPESAFIRACIENAPIDEGISISLSLSGEMTCTYKPKQEAETEPEAAPNRGMPHFVPSIRPERKLMV